MTRLDPHDQRALFATRTLHTVESVAGPEIGGSVLCRVCAGLIRTGDPIRKRQWHTEYSHTACGWLRLPEEHDRHERRRPGTSFSYWEWCCPYCGLDACSPRKPRDEDDPRCKRCRPTPELGAGVTVEVITPLVFRVGRGKRPRRVEVATYTRGVVEKISGEIALVALEIPRTPPQWIRVGVLSVV